MYFIELRIELCLGAKMLKESEIECNKLNAFLPLPKDKIAQNEILAAMKTLNVKNAVLGLKRINDRYVDRHGQPVTFFSWVSGHPNKQAWTGKWKDHAHLSVGCL